MLESINYFENGRDKDKRELELTKKTIKNVSSIFPEVVKENRWQYEISNTNDEEIEISKEKKATYSHSTNAMILFSLIAASGKIRKNSPLIPDVNLIEPFDFQKDKEHVYEGVWHQLIKQIKIEPESEKAEKDQITYSSTFGKNDILTLSWLIEIIKSKIFDRKENESEIETQLIQTIKNKLKNIPTDASIEKSRWLEWKEETQRRSVDHAFLALRYIQLKKCFDLPSKDKDTTSENNDSKIPDSFIGYFDNRIHEQLSKFEIRDGDFDAAELVFALEGLLLVKPLSISRAKLDRIFQVITENQNRNPYWRPIKPIVVTPQGRVLFPLSVETASALLRCCSLIEKKIDEPDYFSKYLDLFRRYAEWIRSRAITGTAKIENKDIKFHGWYSEHVHAHPGIHIWETANVFLFLHYYSFMLEKHIAQRSLEAAGLSAQKLHKKGKDMVEPLNPQGCDEKLQPYSYAEKHLIDPRINRNTEGKAYSILLYGPPGTGKTNFAEYICKKLDRPLITVTPSDFIQGGESQVEARAKRIFEVLEDQFDAVILLDEIDRMILDRSSKGYNAQGDFFQFMTPGMLTKLRNLRKKERCIFIIATNYRERIDSAVIRKGRIDEHLLMSVPDKKARIKILKDLILKKTDPGKREEEPDEVLKYGQNLDQTLEDIAKKTGLYSYSELDGLVKDATAKLNEEEQKQYEKIIDSLSNELQGRANITLTSYKNRFEGDEYPQKPFVEFFVLLHTKLEADSLDKIEKTLVEIVFQKLLESDKKIKNRKADKKAVEEKIKEKFPELGPFIEGIMKGYFG